MLFKRSTECEPESDTRPRINIRCEGIWQMKLRTTGYQERDWLRVKNDTNCELNIIHYCIGWIDVAGKWKSGTSLRAQYGISATILREGRYKTNVENISMWARFHYVCNAWNLRHQGCCLLKHRSSLVHFGYFTRPNATPGIDLILDVILIKWYTSYICAIQGVFTMSITIVPKWYWDKISYTNYGCRRRREGLVKKRHIHGARRGCSARGSQRHFFLSWNGLLWCRIGWRWVQKQQSAAIYILHLQT